MQLLYPLRIKPTFESEHGGESKEQVIVDIDQPEEIHLIEIKPKKEDNGSSLGNSTIQFQAVEDARMTRNVQNGFWVNNDSSI